MSQYELLLKAYGIGQICLPSDTLQGFNVSLCCDLGKLSDYQGQ